MGQNKKAIISYFFILSVVFGLVAPQITNAGLWEAFAKGLSYGVAYTIVPLTKGLAEITTRLLGWITMGDAIKVAYTPHPAGGTNNNTVVDAGWAICRSLANMLIVLGFVVIGIATILRFRDYEAQKLLAPLIIVAILVNFSPVICGLIIDASNITMNFFMRGGSPGDILPTIREQINDVKNSADGSEALAKSISYTAANLIAFFVFGLLFFLLIARYIMLWILVIFSPIAFVCFVFPFSKQYFKAWWDQFFKWCIMGIPAAFTLYLASMTYQIPMSSPTGGNKGMQALMTLLLPAMIMLVGFFYSLKFSGAGAAIAVGAAMATGTALLGAVTGAAKGKGVMGKIGAGMGNLVGGSRPVTAAREALGGGWTATKEALGLAPTGSTAQLKEKRRGEAKKRLDNLSDTKLGKVATGRTHSSTERAAATEILAGRGTLSELGTKKDVAVQRAISHGVKRDVFTKAEPSYAKGGSQEIATAREAKVKELRGAFPGMNEEEAKKRVESRSYKKTIQSEADREAQRNTIRGQSAGELASNLSTSSFGKLETIEDIDINRHLRKPKFRENISPAKIAALKKFATPGMDEHKQITKMMESLEKEADLLAKSKNLADKARGQELYNKAQDLWDKMLVIKGL